MTEAEWLACTDPKPLLENLPPSASQRTLRLFACGCVRRIWHLLDDDMRTAVDIREMNPHGHISDEALEKAQQSARQNHQYWMTQLDLRATRTVRARQAATQSAFCAIESVSNFAVGACSEEQASTWMAISVAFQVRRTLRPDRTAHETKQQVALLRDILGNPFRPVSIDPAWLGWNVGTVPNLAQVIYDERELPSGHLDAGRLAILADALEEAGCTDQNILSHCRGPGPHVRGCWAVDLLLGKE